MHSLASGQAHMGSAIDGLTCNFPELRVEIEWLSSRIAFRFGRAGA